MCILRLTYMQYTSFCNRKINIHDSFLSIRKPELMSKYYKSYISILISLKLCLTSLLSIFYLKSVTYNHKIKLCLSKH